MSEFESIEDELKFMADCSDDRGDSETSLMFVRYLAHIRKLNAELAALKAGQGEAVAPYGYLREVDGNVQLSVGPARPADRSGGCATPWAAIFAAPPASADARLVPVELLELCFEGFDDYWVASPEGIECTGELRALLARQEVK